MKTKITSAILLIVGTLSFNHLFWQQSLGVNLVLFNFLLIGIAIYNLKKTVLKNELIIALLLTFISGLMVVWHNTGLSVLMHFLTTLITLGLIKQDNFKQALEGLAGSIATYLSTPIQWLNQFIEDNNKNRKVIIIYKAMKLVVIPLLLFFIFFTLYRGANPKFEELTQSLMDWFTTLFSGFSLGRVIFLLFGFSLIAFALFKGNSLMDPLIPTSEDLIRKRKVYRNEFGFNRNLYAKIVYEYKVGIIVFSLLNALLLIVNVLDLNWIWFGFEVPLDFNLKQFVHEGTYLLIFSILLSIVVLLYFFRASLNFYPKNKWLKRLGIFWVIQNAILACSVLVRNYHYIDYHGLAGKRIGMIAFLIFTFFGLISLIVKVQRLKSFSYLLRLNSWFILISLTLMSCLNWDRIIVHNNLAHNNPAEIDVDYYLKLSPSVAPIILKNLPTIEKQMTAHLNRVGKERWLHYIDIDLFKQQLEYNTSQHLIKLKNYNWPSWNYIDHRLKQRTTLISQ